MHTFFESIGFGSIKKASDRENLIRDVIMHFDKRMIFKNERDSVY